MNVRNLTLFFETWLSYSFSYPASKAYIHRVSFFPRVRRCQLQVNGHHFIHTFATSDVLPDAKAEQQAYNFKTSISTLPASGYIKARKVKLSAGLSNRHNQQPLLLAPNWESDSSKPTALSTRQRIFVQPLLSAYLCSLARPKPVQLMHCLSTNQQDHRLLILKSATPLFWSNHSSLSK